MFGKAKGSNARHEKFAYIYNYMYGMAKGSMPNMRDTNAAKK